MMIETVQYMISYSVALLLFLSKYNKKKMFIEKKNLITWDFVLRLKTWHFL